MPPPRGNNVHTRYTWKYISNTSNMFSTKNFIHDIYFSIYFRIYGSVYYTFISNRDSITFKCESLLRFIYFRIYLKSNFIWITFSRIFFIYLWISAIVPCILIYWNSYYDFMYRICFIYFIICFIYV